jgi:non-ribosomal peptide synthase protein (TIGR01720 family)
MSDLRERLQSLSPEKRALLERLMNARPAEAVRTAAYAPPRTPHEGILVSAWEEVLGRRVGIHDNFFDLGGDSIHCIQIVAKVRLAGLSLTNQALFESPVIASLAERLEPLSGAPAEQGPVTGEAPLAPIQRWFFSLDLPDRAHWNQSVLLDLPPDATPGHYRSAMDALVAHHDALRLRFYHTGEAWRQEIGPVEPAVFHEAMATSGEPLAALCAAEQQCLRLDSNPLFRALFLHVPEGPAKLLITAHHLLADVVSFRILIEDLDRAVRQLQAARMVQLPLKTSAYLDWARHMSSRPEQPSVAAEIDFWREQLGATEPLVLDGPGGDNVESSAATVRVGLTKPETALFQSRGNPQEMLLEPLAKTLCGWTGRPEISIDLEGHGREVAGADLDVSRTAGWFTALYPLKLTPGRVQQLLRRIPCRGVHYSCLRYSDQPELATLPCPQIMFNYLGAFTGSETSTSFRLAAESPGPLYGPRDRRPHVLQIVGGVWDGRLEWQWIYSRNLHNQASIERLAEQFLAHLRSALQSGIELDPALTEEDLKVIAAAHGSQV